MRKSNIQFLHPECAAPEGRYADQEPQSFIGKFVKRRFVSTCGNGERMWVNVRKVSAEGDLVGNLDNDPVLDVGVKYGDEVVVKLAEIIEVT